MTPNQIGTKMLDILVAAAIAMVRPVAGPGGHDGTIEEDIPLGLRRTATGVR